MSYYTVEVNEIQVLGTLWIGGTAAITYKLRSYDIKNMTNYPDAGLTRDNVEGWLDSHAGDFQGIIDFRADIGPWESDWEKEDSEILWHDCMYGEEE